VPDDAVYKIITGGKKNPFSEKKKPAKNSGMKSSRDKFDIYRG